MTNSFYHRIIYAPIVALVLAFALWGSLAHSATPRAVAASAPPEAVALQAGSPGWDFQAEASELLGEVHGLAAQLHREAQTLESFNRSPRISRESHAAQLTLMRAQVNDVGSRLARLQEIKHVAAPWQQQAINRLQPLAEDVAQHTEFAIVHLNENGNYLFAPSYQEHLAEAMDQAKELKQTAGNFLAYNSAQQRLDRLQSLVELD